MFEPESVHREAANYSDSWHLLESGLESQPCYLEEVGVMDAVGVASGRSHLDMNSSLSIVKYCSILCIAASNEALTDSFGGSKVVVGVAILYGTDLFLPGKEMVAVLTVEVCGCTPTQSLHATLAPLNTVSSSPAARFI